MPGKFHHERLYRGPEALARLAATRLTLCGAGALGSHLADNLARQGFTRLRVIDRDRVEGHNVGTQLYGEAEVGAWKVEALRNRLFRSGVRVVTVKPGLVDTPMTAHLPEMPFAVGPDRVARDILRALERGADVVYTPLIWRLVMLVVRLLPEKLFKKLSF